MKKIKLGKSNKYTLIDDEDFERISKFKFHFGGKSVRTQIYKFVVSGGLNKKKIINCPLARLILNLPINSKKIVDHINNDVFDNRKENLRIVTHHQNHWNRKLNKNNTSGYKGVSWSKVKRKWAAYIRFNSKRYNLGSFQNKIEAAKIYNKKAKEFFGEYAKLNVIPS